MRDISESERKVAEVWWAAVSNEAMRKILFGILTIPVRQRTLKRSARDSMTVIEIFLRMSLGSDFELRCETWCSAEG